MKLEDQVCSLDLAKRLKKLGVTTNSFFRWVLWNSAEPLIWSEDDKELYPFESFIWEKGIAAYTVAELGEVLPYEMGIPHKASDGLWQYDDAIHSLKGGSYHPCFVEKTEADARAKLLIYLIENILYSVEKDRKEVEK